MHNKQTADLPPHWRFMMGRSAYALWPFIAGLALADPIFPGAWRVAEALPFAAGLAIGANLLASFPYLVSARVVDAAIRHAALGTGAVALLSTCVVAAGGMLATGDLRKAAFFLILGCLSACLAYLHLRAIAFRTEIAQAMGLQFVLLVPAIAASLLIISPILR